MLFFPRTPAMNKRKTSSSTERQIIRSSEGFLCSTLVVTGGTLFSRLLGFARDACIAWILGGSGTADALTAALRLPYMVRRLFGEGTLSLALTAACVRERLEGENGLAAAVGRHILFKGGLIVLLVILGAGILLPLTAPGLLKRPDILDEAIRLFRICIPYALFALLAAVGMAELHSRNRFLLPSLMPALFNITVLVSAIPAIYLPPAQAGTLLACGVLCGGLIQWLCLLPATVRPPQTISVQHPSQEKVHTILRSLPAGIFGAAVPQLAFLLASGIASLLPEGHMASLFYAERLLEFPLGVLGAAVGMAAAPRLAALASESHASSKEEAPCSDNDAFIMEIKRAQHISLGLNLPAAAGLAAVSIPLVTLVLGHGAFDTEAIQATALSLCAYAPGLPAYALSRPLLAACQALQDNRTPVRAALPSLLVTVISGLGLMYMAGPWGPPLGVSLGLWCYVWQLRRGLGRFSPSLPCRSLLVLLLGTACTFVSAFWITEHYASGSPLFALGLAVPAGILVYALVLLFGDRQLLSTILRKKTL